MRGKFIVLEGLDGNGKHTQAKLLKQKLSSMGIEAVLTEEPRYGDNIGGFIREWLKGEFEIRSPHAIALLYAADRYEHSKMIEKWLEEGKWVISARYYFSTLAFQGGLHGVDREWIECIHRFCTKPEMAILIDITPEESVKRKCEERYEKLEIQSRVREEYLEMAKNGMLEVVDGMGSIEDVAKKIWEKVEVLL